MTSISYFPVVEEERQLIDILSRAAWFLSFCSIDRIFVPIASKHLAGMQWRVADGMDESITDKFKALGEMLEFVVVQKESDLHACMSEASIILLWKKDSLPTFVSQSTLSAWKKGSKILQVDPAAIRQEGSYYIDVSHGLVSDRKALIHENRVKFQLLASRLGQFDRAYLMATGPSISQYRHFDYSKALSIVCNSVINDEELMKVVRPQILVFADPIFHFGPSLYAATFRAKLAESASKHDYTICIPIKYYPLFTAAMPQLANRTIALPFFKDREFNFDLQHEFMLKTTANILTFLMVPLAATFADEIGFLGCDGRPLVENTYFWGHNPSTQFTDKMANIRSVHPGFFDIDYNDYYLEHCEVLERQFETGEAIGKKFVSLGFSHIPALNNRFGRGSRLAGMLPKVNSSVLVVIDTQVQSLEDPEWKFLDELIKVAVASSSVEKAIVICREDIDPAVLESRSYVMPVLSPLVKSEEWAGSRTSNFVSFGEKFEAAIGQICSRGVDVLFYVPRSMLNEAWPIATLVARYPDARLNINIITTDSGGYEFKEPLVQEFVEWLANSEPRIVATLPNAQARAQIAEMTGSLFEIAPQRPFKRQEGGYASEWEIFVQSLLYPRINRRQEIVKYPRLLVIDLTNMRGFAATSRIKDAFFGTWPDAQFRLVCQAKERHLVFADKHGNQLLVADSKSNNLFGAVLDYRPEVIYYRAIDNEHVHGFACEISARCASSLVIHLMDDWPARLQSTKPKVFPGFDRSLRALLQRAEKCLSIGEKMSSAFERRYGKKFQAFANCIDPSLFPPKPWNGNVECPFVIRYTGALAKDMTFDSICDIAEAIEDLSQELDVRFEIYTRPPWLSSAKERLSGFKAVAIFDQVPAEKYGNLLQQADALLIAYNFDEVSQTYIGYSMANKLPEYLASGVPVIAFGPEQCATISYLRDRACAKLITRRDANLIIKEIRSLIESRELQAQLGSAGRKAAFLHHNIWKVQRDFQKLLADTAREPQSVLLGPYSRHDAVNLDETNCIAELFSGDLSGTTMIDVGAHHGSALTPFLNNGWTVYAFEPDEKNRAILLNRLASYKNKALVSVDTRCVSNKSQKGVSFYRSKQSTGISGLSAFHESHIEAQRVDVTTLTELFQDQPMPKVDFLKIDAEGHDLFVLQGFPWARTKPALIECEFEDAKTTPLGYSFHELARFLLDKGYSVYVSEWHPVIRYGIRHDWRRLMRYPCKLADPKSWGNLLAFRDPIDEKALVATLGKMAKPVTPTIQTAKGGMAVKMKWPGFRIEQSPCYVSAGSNRWRYTHYSDAKQKFWIAAVSMPGRTVARGFVGGLRLLTDRAMTISVSLARYGNADYEGTSKSVKLVPGVAQKVKLSKEFTRGHAAFKLQVEVLELEGGGSALLTVDGLYMSESPASIRRRVGETNLSLREANRLFRERDFSTAMGMYLLLYQRQPLKIYSDNALMAARKLDMDPVVTVEEML